MRKSFFNILATLSVLSVMLSACGGGKKTANDDAPKVTSSGFECPQPNPRMEVTSKELNLFVWTEYFPEDMLNCFKLVYDIKLNLDEYSANEEMYAKVASGGTAYDLVQPTDYIVPLLIRQDVIQTLDHSRLPNMKNLDPNWMDRYFDPANKYTLPYLAGIDAIVVNTDAVENVPTSWADLWNKEYAGRMVSIDDSRTVISMTLLTLGYDPNSRNLQELEEAKNKLKELIPSIKLFDSDSPKSALIAGDVDLGIVWTGEAFVAHQENPAFEFIYPTEGASLWSDNWAMLKNAPHADAAYAWLNYIMQGDVFWLTLRDFQYINPNLAAIEYAKENEPEIYADYNDSPITNPPQEALDKGFYSEDVGEAAALYDRIWTEVKGGD